MAKMGTYLMLVGETATPPSFFAHPPLPKEEKKTIEMIPLVHMMTKEWDKEVRES